MSVWAISLLGVMVKACILWVLLIYFFLPVLLPSEIPKLPIDPPVRGFPGVWQLLLFYDSLWNGSSSQLFCLSFYLLYFVLSPFKENGLPFWVLGVLCQRSEVILWNLLIVQMIFQ